MTVSVVIPAYKAAKTVRGCVESVLAQTAPPLEILVVNDGSPDAADTRVALEGLRGPVRILDRPNGGAAAARNTGVAEARGEWVAFLDADDEWSPFKLERQLIAAQDHPDVAVLASKFWIQIPGSPKGVPLLADEFYGRELRPSPRQAWDVAMSIWTGTVMARRAVLGAAPFDTSLETAEDRDLWVRLLSDHSAYFLTDYLATYMQYGTSLSNSNAERDYASMAFLLERYKNRLDEEQIRTAKSRMLRRLASFRLSRGDYRAAVKPAFQRALVVPSSLEAWWILGKAAAGSLFVRSVK